MGGWTSGGFRVYLGKSHGEEFRDIAVYADDKVIGVTKQRRDVTQERAEFRGLTKAGAAALTPTEGWTIITRNRTGETGQWVVTEELITNGDWEDV
jgi:hypothetical protein